MPSRVQSPRSLVMPMFNGGPRIVSKPALRRYSWTWNIWAVAFIASVPSGRCELCSSIAPIGNRTMSVFFAAASNSGNVMSSIVGYLTLARVESWPFDWPPLMAVVDCRIGLDVGWAAIDAAETPNARQTHA